MPDGISESGSFIYYLISFFFRKLLFTRACDIDYSNTGHLRMQTLYVNSSWYWYIGIENNIGAHFFTINGENKANRSFGFKRGLKRVNCRFHQARNNKTPKQINSVSSYDIIRKKTGFERPSSVYKLYRFTLVSQCWEYIIFKVI